MSLATYKCKPSLKGLYEVTLKSYNDIENDKGGYLETFLDVPNYGEYKYCIFPSQIDYITSCLNAQLGVERDKYNFAEAVSRLETIKIWFSYNSDLGRMNLSFNEPKVQVEKQEEAVAFE